jgi:deoxyadenosine/deoxycytidine kinase
MKITIEGNIPAGKTTLLRNLSCISSEILTFPEPVEKWRNNSTHSDSNQNLLDLMYKEPKKYINEFQLMAQDCLYEAINRGLGESQPGN